MEKQLRMLLPRGKFINVAASRSRSMSCVRGKNNRTTELTLRMAFVRSGFAGWSLHSALVGKPDFYFVRSKTAIFVDGCSGTVARSAGTHRRLEVNIGVPSCKGTNGATDA